jgi:hypothetical protein
MDYLEEYKTALVVTGTVALPFPYPASGRVYVADLPGFAEPLIKIVQILNEKQFKTWLVELAHVRAARVPAAETDKSLAFGGWVLKTGEDLETDTKAALESLEPDQGKSEILLFPQAIVLVRESATVITRFEFVMTAAECAELDWQPFCPPCNPPCH